MDQGKEAECGSCQSALTSAWVLQDRGRKLLTGPRVGSTVGVPGSQAGPRGAGGPGPECSPTPSGRDPGGHWVSPWQCPSLGGGPPQRLTLPQFPVWLGLARPAPCPGEDSLAWQLCVERPEYLALTLVVPALCKDGGHESTQAGGRPWAERRREARAGGEGRGRAPGRLGPALRAPARGCPDGPPPPAAPSAGYPPRQLGHHLPGTETPRSSRRKMQNPKPGSWRKARPQGPARTPAPPSGGGMVQPRATGGAAPQVPCTRPLPETLNERRQGGPTAPRTKR